MKHLHEMCCAACREKLEEIERRAYDLNEFYEREQLYTDRRELLDIVEALLLHIAVNRKSWAELAKLLPALLPPTQAQ